MRENQKQLRERRPIFSIKDFELEDFRKFSIEST